MSSALLGGSTTSPLATSAIPSLPIVATSVTADQRLTVGPYANSTVSLVETASAGGVSLSLVDSAGAGASVPLYSILSSGGPPITTSTMDFTPTTFNVESSAVQFLAVAPATTGVSLNSTAGSTILRVIDGAGAGSALPVLTITSTGGPPVTAATAAYSVPVSHNAATQSGVATIAIGQSTIAVAAPAITANSVVMFSPLSAPDATCVGIRVVLTAGTGFSLTGAANATAAVPLGWFVAKY